MADNDIESVNVSLSKETYSKVSKNAFENSMEVEKYIENIVENEVNQICLSNGFTYSSKEKKIYLNEKVIPLTRKEEKVLEVLVNKINTPVQIEEFYKIIWNTDTLSASRLCSLRNFIKAIRDKTTHNLIKSVSGQGYMIVSRKDDI
jgi:DNA-binding response OmpR family regulator